MGRDVRAALEGDVPGLPCQYLYDDRGSRLFEEITRQPEYYQTRTEEAILQEHAPDVIARTDPREVVEIGSGAGRKITTVLDALRASGKGERCILFDINASFVEASVRRLRRAHPELEVRGVIGQFPDQLGRLGPGGQRLLLFLGGTIGNVPPPDVPGFLRQVAEVLGAGDALLMGVDLVKSRERLEAAYNDRAGVTAEFNLNLLRVLNRELGADFDLDAFQHVARWDDEHQWIDIRVRSLRDQQVRIPAIDRVLELPAGAEIRTELSCKYTRGSLERTLDGTGLCLSRWYTDRAGDFGVALLTRGAPQEIAP